MRFNGTQSPLGVVRGRSLGALVAVNAALLGLLGLTTFAPTVEAQARGRSEYTMVGGSANGADGSAVYIVDTTNQELIAITYNQNTKRLEGIGYRNLATDAADLLRGRTRPGS